MKGASYSLIRRAGLALALARSLSFFRFVRSLNILKNRPVQTGGKQTRRLREATGQGPKRVSVRTLVTLSSSPSKTTPKAESNYTLTRLPNRGTREWTNSRARLDMAPAVSSLYTYSFVHLNKLRRVLEGSSLHGPAQGEEEQGTSYLADETGKPQKCDFSRASSPASSYTGRRCGRAGWWCVFTSARAAPFFWACSSIYFDKSAAFTALSRVSFFHATTCENNTRVLLDSVDIWLVNGRPKWAELEPS